MESTSSSQSLPVNLHLENVIILWKQPWNLLLQILVPCACNLDPENGSILQKRPWPPASGKLWDTTMEMSLENYSLQMLRAAPKFSRSIKPDNLTSTMWCILLEFNLQLERIPNSSSKNCCCCCDRTQSVKAITTQRKALFPLPPDSSTWMFFSTSITDSAIFDLILPPHSFFPSFDYRQILLPSSIWFFDLIFRNFD